MQIILQRSIKLYFSTSLDYSIAKATNYLISNDNSIEWIPVGFYLGVQNFTTKPRFCKIIF